VAALSEVISRAIAIDDSDLVVDLSEVEFMDAATVGVITRTRDFLHLRERALAVRSPSACARRVFDLCGLADLLDPLPLGVPHSMTTAAALGTWVPVPATNRSDRSNRSEPKAIGASARIRVGANSAVSAEQKVS
jgi:anti-anti-sigma factor